MQISLQWVNELINIKTVNLDYLIEKLTLGGFEVEEILEIELGGKKTLTLDISATANRSDSLSIRGISKEIATLLNKPYKNSQYLIPNLGWETNFKKLSKNSKIHKDCSTFLGITIENINNFESPKWLNHKLIQSGLETSNNFLDFQHYFLLESGYPLESYDLNQIYSRLKTKDFTLRLTNSNPNQEFLASNTNNYKLNDSILTLKANDLTIGLAGIISHKDFCYTDKTTSLLLEASIFDSTTIRQQSRFLGLRTDRSARYERSIKNTDLIPSVYKLVNILKIKNPNLICTLHTLSNVLEEDPKILLLNYKKINEILGPIKGSNENQVNYINPSLISTYLDRLQFDYQFNDSDLSWEIKIPNSRTDDITREIDLIEEVGRLHGFNKFLTRLPIIEEVGIEDISYQTKKKLTMYFLKNGFNELIHYSLVDDSIVLSDHVNLINPLLSDCSNLRSSLLPSLIKTIQENLKQGNFYMDSFEYGHIFSKDEKNKFKEQEYVSGIFGGTKSKFNWAETPQSISWFEGKGKIEQIFNQLNCLIYWKPSSDLIYKNILHPYRTAQVLLTNNKSLGIFGQINPILAKKLNISPNLYLFEFNFDLIKSQFNNNKLVNYKEYSLYPKIIKDLSFVIDSKIPFNEIKDMLFINGSKYLTTITLLDEYKGSSIPKNCTSLCVQLTFQSNKKTLQNSEIENIVKILQKNLTKNFNALIRT